MSKARTKKEAKAPVRRWYRGLSAEQREAVEHARWVMPFYGEFAHIPKIDDLLIIERLQNGGHSDVEMLCGIWFNQGVPTGSRDRCPECASIFPKGIVRVRCGP